MSPSPYSVFGNDFGFLNFYFRKFDPNALFAVTGAVCTHVYERIQKIRRQIKNVHLVESDGQHGRYVFFGFCYEAEKKEKNAVKYIIVRHENYG